jgi:integrase/recombinase XerD
MVRRKNNSIKYTFSKEQLIRLFEAINVPKVAMMFFIALTHGMRISEVVKLKWSNIDFAKQEIDVMDSKWKHRARDGKGKDRRVIMHLLAYDILLKWKEITGGGEWLFSSDNNPNKHMQKKTLNEQFAHFRRTANLDHVSFETSMPFNTREGKVRLKRRNFKYTFHCFRAFYITDLENKGVPPSYIAQQVGHSDITTTMGYVRYNDVKAREVLTKAFNMPYNDHRTHENSPRFLNNIHNKGLVEVVHKDTNAELKVRELELQLAILKERQKLVSN